MPTPIPTARTLAVWLATNRLFQRRTVLGGLVGTAVGSALLRSPGALAQSPVKVTREAAKVVRRQFDPRRPPSDMPKLTPPESGVCNVEFELDNGVAYSIEEVSRTAVKVFVDELDIITRQTITIFTIVNAPPKLIAHEEGHRLIGEYYYKNGAAIAETVAKALIGASFDGAGTDRASAERDGFQKIIAALEAAYMARTRVRAFAANNRFDDITRHGLEPIGETEAIAMAVAVDPEP